MSRGDWGCGSERAAVWRIPSGRVLDPPLLESVGTTAHELFDGDFGALARSFGDFFYASVYYFADGFQEFDARVR